MRTSADRGEPAPNGSERLQAKFGESAADAQSVAKRAATIDERTIAALKAIGTALTDLSDRTASLEHRSSESTFETLRSSVEELSQSLEHNRAITNKSIEEFDQRLALLAKYAVALNQKITQLPAATVGKDKAQSEPSIQIDSVAGLLYNVQASVSDLIERIERLERRITKLEPRETAISEAAIEASSDGILSKSDNQIVHETKGAVYVASEIPEISPSPLAREEPLVAKAGSPAVASVEEQQAGQISLSLENVLRALDTKEKAKVWRWWRRQ